MRVRDGRVREGNGLRIVLIGVIVWIIQQRRYMDKLNTNRNTNRDNTTEEIYE